MWQDDIVHEDLTVRENLAYSAKLRCIATEDRAYLSDVVDDVIELLGLRHVQHSVVGSVEKRGVRWIFQEAKIAPLFYTLAFLQIPWTASFT